MFRVNWPRPEIVGTKGVPTLLPFLPLGLWIIGTFYCTQALAAWAPVPVEDLVREADLIAVVQVLQTELEQAPVTANLEIQELLKAPAGFSAPAIKVRLSSPIILSGTVRLALANEVNYTPGERAVVFLKATTDSGIFEMVRGILGKHPIVDGRVSLENMALTDYIRKIRVLFTTSD